MRYSDYHSEVNADILKPELRKRAIHFNYGQFQVPLHCHEVPSSMSRKEERMIAKELC
jgi:hypothetical protein